MPVEIRTVQSNPKAYHEAMLQRNQTLVPVEAALEAYQEMKRLERLLRETKQVPQEDVQRAKEQVRQILWQLPNWVDTCWTNDDDATNDTAQSSTTLPPETTDAAKSLTTLPPETTIDDASFCAGLYDTIANYSILTALGTSVLETLQDDISQGILQALAAPSTRRWQVPASMEEYNREQYQDTFGDIDEPTTVPSFWTIVNEQKGTYFDRQLPHTCILQVMDSSTTPRTTRRHWIDQLSVRQHLELAIVTGPSFDLDTTPMCRSAVLALQAALAKLGPFQTKVIDAEHLERCESSRVQLECRTTHRVLASLHNYREYCTGRLLRYGTTKECLHVTRITLHSVDILDWAMVSNVTSESVRLPDGTTLPFVRSIAYGKSGRRIVHNLLKKREPASSNQVMKSHPAEAATASYSFLPFYATT